MSGWDDDVDRDAAAPICGACGVTALVSDDAAASFVCENPDCEAYGDPV